jgi:hypothetical protein
MTPIAIGPFVKRTWTTASEPFFLQDDCHSSCIDEQGVLLVKVSDDPNALPIRVIRDGAQLCPYCHEYQRPTESGHCPGCAAGLMD